MTTTADTPRKTCGLCRQELPVTAFSLDRSRHDGRFHACRQCYRDRRAARKARGICRQCSEPAVKGRAQCERHITEGRERQRYRASLGLCACCSNAATPGKTRCDDCRKKKAKKSA